MKLVIDISDEIYESTHKAFVLTGFERVIRDGKLFDDVLDAIRAEIIDKSYLSYDNNPRHVIDESWVLEIIDRYKAESDPEKRKPCINSEDGCEEWAGGPCVHDKAESEVENADRN